MDKLNAQNILDKLALIHKTPVCELTYFSVFELLIAVILSAQCTDKRVNMITPGLFSKCKTPEDYIALGEAELGKIIYSCGFYKNKARNIIAACKDIIEKFGGKVPDTVEELETLSGVGRKTAGVVYAVGFGGQALPVDTHVFRVSRRLNMADANTPEKVSDQLMALIPEEKWTLAHHLLLHHGRYICKAPRPLCEICNLTEICPYYKKARSGK